MTINWFSPLPPVRSGIAEHAAGVLPALAERADVVVWSSEKQWSPALEKHVAVKRYRAEASPWEELCSADISVFHLGNNSDFHSPIWRVSRQHPGVIILHDTKLQHFF